MNDTAGALIGQLFSVGGQSEHLLLFCHSDIISFLGQKL